MFNLMVICNPAVGQEPLHLDFVLCSVQIIHLESKIWRATSSVPSASSSFFGNPWLMTRRVERPGELPASLTLNSDIPVSTSRVKLGTNPSCFQVSCRRHLSLRQPEGAASPLTSINPHELRQGIRWWKEKTDERKSKKGGKGMHSFQHLLTVRPHACIHPNSNIFSQQPWETFNTISTKAQPFYP